MEIKKEFTKELILRIYQARLLIKVEIDTSDFALRACLQQKHKDGIQYPVAYYSQKITLLKLNYDIYNKELLAIVTALKKIESILTGDNRAICY